MIFEECGIGGAYLISPQPHSDHRGSFARAWCEQEFAAHGISFTPKQANVGFSIHKGTLRGIHFQRAPDLEAKLVRCTRGSVFDVVVDLRPDSTTYCKWYGAELTPENGKMLLVPECCGHGCVTLEDNSEIYYLTSAVYAPQSATGARFDDPAFGIDWPVSPEWLSDQDQSWPDWSR